MTAPWIPGQLDDGHAGQKWMPNGAAGELTVTFNRREGGAWVSHTAVPKVWNGTEWLVKQPKRFDGSGWVGLP